MAQAPDPPARPDPNLGILLRDPYLAFSAELLRRLQAMGYDDLRPAHLVVFQHIDPAGSRVTDLAARAQMAKPSMGYLVDHLEAAGYVRRDPDPADGRARLARLTDRGWQQVEDALDTLAAIEAEIADALGHDDVARLRDLLARVGAVVATWPPARA